MSRENRDPVSVLFSFVSGFLPDRLLREIGRVRDASVGFDEMIREIRLHADRPAFLLIGGRTAALPVALTGEELFAFVRGIAGGSLYAYLDCIREGYLPLPGGSRAGIAGDFVTENGRIAGIRRVDSVVIRVPHAVKSAGELAERVFRREGCRRGLLIFAPPGCGKTTVLRDLGRRLAGGPHPLRTAIVDCRGELSGDWYGAGACVDLLTGCGKAEGIALATRTLSPDVILIDEIGGAEEVAAIRGVESGGVPIVATVHGSSLERLFADSPISPLLLGGTFGGFVGIRRAPDGGFLRYEAEKPREKAG